MLCKRHRTGVKPAVDYFRNSVHFLTALRTRNNYFINIRTMKLDFCILRIAGKSCKLFPGADRNLLAALTLPDIKRSSPVTVSGNRPVLKIFQPVAESSFSDGFGNPVDCIIIGNHVILNGCHFDIPGFSCIVNKRSIASPAVRVIMLCLRGIKKNSALGQIL